MKPTISETTTRFRSVLAAVLDVDEDHITPDKTWNDLGLDSLDQIETVMALEEEFGVDIRTEDVPGSQTLGSAIDELFKRQTSRLDRKKRTSTERATRESGQMLHEYFGHHLWDRVIRDLRRHGLLQRKVG